MQKLFETIEMIEEKLEQILQITNNQRAILLQKDASSETVGLLEEMAKYKESFTTEIESIETVFQEAYNKQKENIQKEGKAQALRQHVENVLGLKETIIKAESQNVILMKEYMKNHLQPVKFQAAPDEVINQYKVQKQYQSYQKS